MKAWSLFLKDVLPHVPGCPEVVAEHALKRAGQEFFAATRCWRIWLGDILTVADQTDYLLFLEPKSELVRLERAVLDGTPIDVRTVDMLPADWQVNPQRFRTGIHTCDCKTVTLVPAADADLTLSIEASLKPSNDATGIDDAIYDRHVAHIAAGAVAALKGHTEKPYSDPNGALMWRGKFENYMAECDFMRFRGHSSTRPRRRAQTF